MDGYVDRLVTSSAECAGMYMPYSVFMNVPMPLMHSRENTENQQHDTTIPNLRHRGKLSGSLGSSVGMGMRRTSLSPDTRTTSPMSCGDRVALALATSTSSATLAVSLWLVPGLSMVEVDGRRLKAGRRIRRGGEYEN